MIKREREATEHSPTRAQPGSQEAPPPAGGEGGVSKSKCKAKLVAVVLWFCYSINLDLKISQTMSSQASAAARLSRPAPPEAFIPVESFMSTKEMAATTATHLGDDDDAQRVEMAAMRKQAPKRARFCWHTTCLRASIQAR